MHKYEAPLVLRDNQIYDYKWNGCENVSGGTTSQNNFSSLHANRRLNRSLLVLALGGVPNPDDTPDFFNGKLQKFLLLVRYFAELAVFLELNIFSIPVDNLILLGCYEN